MAVSKRPGPKPRPLAERFWSHVDQSGGPDACWAWLGATSLGYGKFEEKTAVGRRRSQAHRFAYELAIGPIPEGLVLDHLCELRACCNPAHLDPVTQVVNLRRSHARGRHRNAFKTHCPAGHPYDEANTIIWSDGLRRCRACREARRSA